MSLMKILVTFAVIANAAMPALRAQSTVACSKMTGPSTDHATMDHSAHAQMLEDCGPLPASPGQAAYGAIAEIVRLLKADPNTDWSKVNLEALRQHLIDMDDVTMHASVVQRNVAGGVELVVSGAGRTADAIKRMVTNHAKMLDQGGEYHASATPTADGAIITVTAKNAADARAVAQLRGLGFAGLMTEGDHHAAHHLAVARGEPAAHGR
jgi:hypothetical protein